MRFFKHVYRDRRMRDIFQSMMDINLDIDHKMQSNLVIRNFLVTLKLFLNAKCSLFLWSKLAFGHGKWFLNTNLFFIKQFLITKFDCICRLRFCGIFLVKGWQKVKFLTLMTLRCNHTQHHIWSWDALNLSPNITH